MKHISRTYLWYFALFTALSACSSIRVYPYFALKENEVIRFEGTFTKDKNDDFYSKIDSLYTGILQTQISKSDTIFDALEVIYKTIPVEGHKVFYGVQTKDTLKSYISFSQNHFLFSALAFYNDTVFLAPVPFRVQQLVNLKWTDFKYKIPPIVHKGDSIFFQNGEKKSYLYGFKKNNVEINQRKISNCLQINLLDIWPDTTYHATVWLHKKYGIIKWIRTTGRIDTRIL